MSKITCKGGTKFLEIETLGESKHLNPFQININKIRYIREYTEDKSDKADKVDGAAWAIFIGNKMYATRDDLGLNDAKPGDVVDIGDCKFECQIASGLTEKEECRYFINYENILFSRKFFSNNVEKNNKNDRKPSENTQKSDKFAVITVDERIIPITNK